jgi:hypothetical protein
LPRPVVALMAIRRPVPVPVPVPGVAAGGSFQFGWRWPVARGRSALCRLCPVRLWRRGCGLWRRPMAGLWWAGGWGWGLGAGGWERERARTE